MLNSIHFFCFIEKLSSLSLSHSPPHDTPCTYIYRVVTVTSIQNMLLLSLFNLPNLHSHKHHTIYISIPLFFTLSFEISPFFVLNWVEGVGEYDGGSSYCSVAVVVFTFFLLSFYYYVFWCNKQ